MWLASAIAASTAAASSKPIMPGRGLRLVPITVQPAWRSRVAITAAL